MIHLLLVEKIMKNKSSVNLTEGSIIKGLVLFALPLLGSSLVQQLYNTVDIFFISRALGKYEAAAVGASSMMITCLIGLFGGLSIGAGVAVARRFGAGNNRGVKNVIDSSVILTFISSILIMLAGFFLAPAYIHLVDVPETVADLAIRYLRIYFVSTPFIVSYNMGCGIIRSMGQSFWPLLFQIAGGFTNVVMDAVFIFGFHMGVDGVAWATLASQGAAAFFTVYYLQKKTDPEIRMTLRSLCWDQSCVSDILRVGIPAGCQTLVIALSNVIAQYHINSLGVDSIAAFTTYFRVELPIYLPIVAIGQAATTFVSQNIGAGKVERARKGTGQCFLISFILTAGVSAVLLLAGEQAFGLFNKDEAVIREGIRIIRVSFPFYVIYCVLQIYGDALKGMGKASTVMLITMANICIIRSILLFLIVPVFQSAESVAVTYPVTWTLTSIGMILYYRKYTNTKQKATK